MGNPGDQRPRVARPADPDAGTADLLRRTAKLAIEYRAGLGERPVAPRTTAAALQVAFGGPLPDLGEPAGEVIERLAREIPPGLMAMPGPRFFGFVTGGAVPVTVAADWLASAWDQNGAMYVMSPAVAVIEDIVAAWILELLRLPPAASVGFVTGCHMANFTCLAAARHEVLRRAGWNVESQGLQRAPRVRAIVGGEVHISAMGALRYLGFGTEELEVVPADGQGRMRPDALRSALASADGPTIVCAQAGNVSSGASDPLGDIVALAHARGAWVHVDGAFGLWASAVPDLRRQVEGIERADSWATDAHKWLNVPYDSGLAIVADPAPHRAAMGLKASYLQRGADEERVGMDWAPESSRRGRVVPLYALIRALGRQGVVDLVQRTCRLARRMAERLSREPGVEILNEVVLNQVLVRFDELDDRTRDVVQRLQDDGTAWFGGGTWHGKAVMRISVISWWTRERDVDRSVEAIRRCLEESRRAG